jgi:Fur family ferric uptake transcriptional regulator/Fur family peroxide stress response transcriptional regulator
MNTKDRLLQFGIKPSVQRMAVMEYLVENPVHPTADMIFNYLSPSIPTLSKTTVYNTLKLLEEQGAIQTISIDEKNVRYDADISLHAHFKCKKCGRIVDIYSGEFNTQTVPDNDKLRITDCQVYYKGYCEECQK